MAALVVVATVGLVAIANHPTAPTSSAVNYASEVVRIPVNGGNLSGPESNFSFGGILFHLWPEYIVGTNWLTGAAVGPSGMELALIDTNNVSWAVPPGCRACGGLSNFTAADKTFGVTWLSSSAHSDTVLLRAAWPQPEYALSTVTFPPGDRKPDCQLGFCNVTFQGITFHFSEFPPNPAGSGFDIVAVGANGSTLLQSALGGPPAYNCGIRPPGVSLPIMCEETMSNNLRVGVAWDGDQNVTLIIRSASPEL
ncbi:MAG TPA: hypothetical protein VMI55_03460 [Thermoplasmata archaeon]|nr:hypothetical protein [Thermoplasmata archaeon]